MSKLSSSSKKSGIMKLKSLLMGRKSSSNSDNHVPADVKEGHFAVIAAGDCPEQPWLAKSKRFVIPLSYLSNPRFLMLLEHAAEVYGFDHQGALTIPCPPAELERILAVG